MAETPVRLVPSRLASERSAPSRMAPVEVGDREVGEGEVGAGEVAVLELGAGGVVLGGAVGAGEGVFAAVRHRVAVAAVGAGGVVPDGGALAVGVLGVEGAVGDRGVGEIGVGEVGVVEVGVVEVGAGEGGADGGDVGEIRAFEVGAGEVGVRRGWRRSRSAIERSAPVRSQAWRSAPARSAPDRSAPGWKVLGSQVANVDRDRGGIDDQEAGRGKRRGSGRTVHRRGADQIERAAEGRRVGGATSTVSAEAWRSAVPVTSSWSCASASEGPATSSSRLAPVAAEVVPVDGELAEARRRDRPRSAHVGRDRARALQASGVERQRPVDRQGGAFTDGRRARRLGERHRRRGRVRRHATVPVVCTGSSTSTVPVSVIEPCSDTTTWPPSSAEALAGDRGVGDRDRRVRRDEAVSHTATSPVMVDGPDRWS